MNEGDFVLFSYELGDKGQSRRLIGHEIHEKIKSKTLAWVHLDATHEQTPLWLNENIDYLDPLIVDALLAEETRPRTTFHENGAMIILRGMNFNDNSKPEDMISIRLWIDQHRIISIQRRGLKAVQDVRNTLENGQGPRDSGEFIGFLCDRLFERMQPVLADIAMQIDDIEDDILSQTDITNRNELNDIRHKTLIFKRYITPQKDIMNSLVNADMSWIKKGHKRIFQENSDRLTRYTEELDMLRERSQMIKEEIMATLSDKMNKNMYSLSIIAGIFLPLSFLTGLLGINVGGMPGVDNDMAFWIVVGACILSGMGFVALFKILKWI